MSEDVFAERSTVVGVFEHRDDLERALSELTAAGFREEQIGVAMRGLQQEDRPPAGHREAAAPAVRSVLSVRVEGRAEEAEGILRRNGADEIHWTNARTVGAAGTSQEIVDGE